MYIFWFLHQTTTVRLVEMHAKGCISFDSYIKPQLVYLRITVRLSCISFDSYIKPQHNSITPFNFMRCISFDSYIKPQLLWSTWRCHEVVYLLIPTSNHNFPQPSLTPLALYIFWFLHQTTTFSWECFNSECCISFDSYIKPQLGVTN